MQTPIARDRVDDVIVDIQALHLRLQSTGDQSNPARDDRRLARLTSSHGYK